MTDSRILDVLEDILTAADGLAVVQDVMLADQLASGESTMPRVVAGVTTIAHASQSLRLAYFTASKTETANSVRVLTGSTAAGATPSLVRIGLYTIAANGDGTLVASTPNDTTLLAVVTTAYTKAFSAGYAKTAGERLAIGVLVVTAAAAPTLVGASSVIASESAMAPRLSGLIAAQANLPASFLAASVTDSAFRDYAALLP